MKTLLTKLQQSRVYIILLGAAATIWFLVRVIPKPSRAKYPCIQAAAPIMSSFIIYLLSISVGIFSFKKFKAAFQSSKYWLGTAFLFLTIISFAFVLINDNKTAIANNLTMNEEFPINSNEPIGEAKGLFPGRVVWVQNTNATNENFEPGIQDEWAYNYTDETTIQQMLAKALKNYTETSSSSLAWDALFKSFNNSHDRGDVGYTTGEKIAIKINLTNQCCIEEARMDATPQLINALLYQLINEAGVNASDIIIGDPYRMFRNEYKDLVQSNFPNVNFVDGRGGGGINQTEPSSNAVLFFAGPDDNGLMVESTLPQHYIDATYMINMPVLKTHNEGGITLIAKNHQGSFLEPGDPADGQFAIRMHYSLPANSSGTGKYRHTVDYMGHEHTGGKGLLYIVDGIWAGESWEGFVSKFQSAPFNNDYPNSIFIGQDPVALESVCFDVLFEEYATDDNKQSYPIWYKDEIADYLSQMASSDYWPSGITYDPEGDGTALESLGVFEHWNNASDRQYSRNLGTGEGIELKYYYSETTAVQETNASNAGAAYPNPMSNYTNFTLPTGFNKKATVNIYNTSGQVVSKLSFDNKNSITWNGTDLQNNKLPNALYLFTISDNANTETGKIIIK